MLLFLDVISPIPEFFVIEENKVILQTKIISKNSNRLSDNIFETYMKINKSHKLSKNIKKIAMTIGPGSYTSLRVGCAFISGLIISKNLPFCSISAIDIIKLNSQEQNINEIGIFIYSANNQKFLCYINKNGKENFLKIEKNNFELPKNIKKVLYNCNKLEIKRAYQYKFTFADMLIENYTKLNFKYNEIIIPIYISNNKILN